MHWAREGRDICAAGRRGDRESSQHHNVKLLVLVCLCVCVCNSCSNNLSVAACGTADGLVIIEATCKMAVVRIS